MAKLNNVEIHFKHSNRTYNSMTAFLVMIGNAKNVAKGDKANHGWKKHSINCCVLLK